MASISKLRRIEHKLKITEDDPDGVVCVLERLTFGEFNEDKRVQREMAFRALRASAPALALQQEAEGDSADEKLASLERSMSRARDLLSEDRENAETKADAEALAYLTDLVRGKLREVRNLDCDDGQDPREAVLEFREFCVELADRLRAEANLSNQGKG